MAYPRTADLKDLAGRLEQYAQLQHEYRAKGIGGVLAGARGALAKAVREMKRLAPDPKLAGQEPSALAAIQRLRPAGPRRLWQRLDRTEYTRRLEGAMLARMAGCTLGAIVECWPVEKMQRWAQYIGDPFPPTDYWTRADSPNAMRYKVARRDQYTRTAMRGVPVDDDVTYTLLGLLILEEFGPNFTTADIGRAWVKYLPLACTAEEIALDNLKAGIPAGRAAVVGNPFCQWIGADIRSDPWGWAAPAWPQRAAEMAWQDAYLSHRRNGIYGAMFFAAAQSAAFAVDHPLKAIRIGLTEIPARSRLAQDVRWALKMAPRIRDYRDARAAVDKRFAGMHTVHTNNNACLTIFGLAIGGTDVTRVLSETVAMGLDNDCTTATAGSIVGAVVGKAGVPAHWYRPFRDTVHSYLNGRKHFRISNLVTRFARQAARVYAQG